MFVMHVLRPSGITHRDFIPARSYCFAPAKRRYAALTIRRVDGANTRWDLKFVRLMPIGITHRDFIPARSYCFAPAKRRYAALTIRRVDGANTRRDLKFVRLMPIMATS